MRKFLTLLLLPLALFAGESPEAIWLTWQTDPATTMTIQWLTDGGDKNDHIDYRQKEDETMRVAHGAHTSLPDPKLGMIHRAELTGLKPDTTYEFSLANYEGKWRFRTMPENLENPIRFIVGGDMYHDTVEDLSDTNRQAAQTNPRFAIAGGDIAYSGSKLWFIKEDGKRWITWLKSWYRDMVTPDGLLIPVIAVIGNHEVNGRFGQTPNQAKFFYTLFPIPHERAYRTLDFGDYMTLVLLDSGHTAPVKGKQTDWLKESLDARQNIPNKFAVYHVPAYPSIRSPKNRYSSTVRKHWVPLFETYNLTTAFEHHDHAYKRTHKIRNGQQDPTGVLYLGDGAWGPDDPRTPDQTPWYIDKVISRRHFIEVDLSKETISYSAISDDGALLDKSVIDSKS